MEILKEIVPIKGIALALGFFDGIHIGHKKIFSALLDFAKKNNTKTGVITFSKNPNDYFSKNPTLSIQNLKNKERILENLGIDYLFELDFEKYKDMEACDYLKNILVKNFEPSIIIAGYNHTFGKNRFGRAKYLEENQEKYNYKCLIIPEYKYNNTLEVSSSFIRKNIILGNFELVYKLLDNRYFSVENVVIAGDKIAQTFGYPTANLNWENNLIKPFYGVYFGFGEVEGSIIPSLISWGNKPTLSSGKNEILEAHLYNYNDYLYGKKIKVYFAKKLRNEQKFSDINSLETQIKRDYLDFEQWIKTL